MTGSATPRSFVIPLVTALGAVGLVGSGLTSAATAEQTSPTISAQSVASVTGSWSAVGGSPNGPVLALTMDSSGSLYVGGDFNDIDGRSFANIARWGEPIGGGDDTYSALGAGLDDTVRALAWDDTLYIGGQFTSEVGGLALSGVAAWAQRSADDTYVSLGAGVVTTDGQNPTKSVRTILPTDDTIYFGGEFASASSVSGTRRLAGWIDDTWVSVGGGLPGTTGAPCSSRAERVVALAVFPGQELVVGGKFECAGDTTPDDTNIATWTGSQWNPMGGGLRPVNPSASDIAGALIADGGTLYVGGNFAEAGPPGNPVTAGSLATWDGSTWAGIGDGVAGTCGASTDSPIVSAMSLDSSRGLLYVAGAFCRAGDDTVNSIVVRDLRVDEWVPFIAPGSIVGLTRDDTSHRIAALARDDSVLYVGGRFTLAGGAGGPSNIARWTWDPPAGTNAIVASPGDAVSISGSRFIGVADSGGVFIGGMPVSSYTRVSTGQIIGIMVPDGVSGTVAIEVEAVGGRAVVGTLTVPAPIPAGAPRDVTAVAGDASAVVSWSAPASSGSFPVTTYQVEGSPSGSCLVPAATLSCEVTGLRNGVAYAFRVRALTGAGWGAWSDSVSAVPEPPVPASIMITGSRGDVRGKPGIIVAGESQGLGSGAILRPRVRFPGQSQAIEGSARIIIDASGDFTWQRRTGKKAYVTVGTEDGSLRSNRVIIPARSR